VIARNEAKFTRNARKALFGVFASAAFFGAVSQAFSSEVQVTYTGTIIGGDGATDGNPALDRLGLFGAIGANLTGDSYTSTYVFNTGIGNVTSSACLPASAGCSSGQNLLLGNTPGNIPVVSETLTINGHSFSFGGPTFPVNSAQLEGINDGASFPSSFSAEVDANSFLNSLRNNLFLTDGSLPSSLVTPFSYTVQPGDGANSTDSFFQADTSGGLDRFEFDINSVALADVSAVPEPSTWMLLLTGLAALGLVVCKGARKGNTVIAVA
jgi:hypothetical protein